ncbi:MAG: GDP-mannose 4,6-dehydratase, partial [Proteobacteria bacterium]|nr:GDP-mannose 4,6-dehydratase [Pseudomonadota bacterium]
MTKALITGSSGFVGAHLWDHLSSLGFEVHGMDRTNTNNKKNNNTFTCDLLDVENLSRIITKISPDYVFHLAAQSSVKDSWENPELTYNVNVNGTKNLLDAIEGAGIKSRILVISSSQVYGAPRKVPISESHPLKPSNPYAKSKLEQEKLCGDYALDIVISRSFNHTGPGQSPSFVCSDFARQIADIKKGLKEPTMRTGNLKSERDFTDVRDIVRAYQSALEKCSPGGIYNICSGQGYSAKEILDLLMEVSGVDMSHHQHAGLRNGLDDIHHTRNAFELDTVDRRFFVKPDRV